MRKIPLAVLTSVGTPLLLVNGDVWGATKNAPQLPMGSSSSPALLGSVVSMVVVIGLAWFGLRFFLKRFKVTQKGNIEVLAVKQIAQNKSVQIIDVYGKQYLLGVAESITVLSDITGQIPEDEATGETMSPVFFRNTITNHISSLRESLANRRNGGGGND